MTRPRRSLFIKYFVTLFVAVVMPLMLGSATEAWFAFRDNRFDLNELLQVEARSAADRIQAFTDGIRDQLGWVVQFPWTQGEDDRRRIDGLRLLQQVPAIVSLSMVDPTGTERVFVSRVSMNRTGRGADMSADPAVVGARANRVWYGPVHYQRDSEPYMRIAVAGNRAAAGIVVADINLKLIWDIIAAIKIGDTGHALVVDDFGASDRPSGHQPCAAQRCRRWGFRPSQGRRQRCEWIGGRNDRRGRQARRCALGACSQRRLDGDRAAAGRWRRSNRSAPRCGVL